MDGTRPRPDATQSSIIEAESSHALKRKRTEFVDSSPQSSSTGGLRAIRSTRPSTLIATPVIRSEPHPVYVQPVRELSLRRRLRDACRMGRRLRATLPSTSRMPFEVPESAPALSSSDVADEGQPDASTNVLAGHPQHDGPADVCSPDPPPARSINRSVSELMLEASTIESQASRPAPNIATGATERPGAFPGPSILLETAPACRNPIGTAAAPTLDRYYSHARASAAVPPPPRNEPILPPPSQTLPQAYNATPAPSIQRQPKARRPNFWKRFSSKSRSVQVPQQVTAGSEPAFTPIQIPPVPPATVRPASSSTWLSYRPDNLNTEASVTPAVKRPSVDDLESARACEYLPRKHLIWRLPI